MSAAARGFSAVTSTRREALQLYREILRTCRKFTYPNEKGQLWSDILKKSARTEFEAARYERDPEILMRLLVQGRDALQQVQLKFEQKKSDIIGKAAGSNGPNM